MGNVQIISDIWRRKLINKNPDISDIIESYDLNSEQQTTVNEYISKIDKHLSERARGFPSLNSFRENYLPIVKKANNYATVAGGLIGGILVYLADKNPLSMVLGAASGGFVIRYVEDVFHPLARIMGMPNTENVEGSLLYLKKARENAEKKLQES
jgi:hypothetical protein